MARIILNRLVERASGRIGEIEFRRHNGVDVAQKRQERRAPWSQAQRQHRVSFKKHTAFAERVRADASLRQLYGGADVHRPKRLNYWQAAIRDRAQPPKIPELRDGDFQPSKGGHVFIYAVDDFEVTRVHVAVRDGSGGLLMCGEAEPWEGRWRFNLPAPATGQHAAAEIVATAFDRPGNFAIGRLPLGKC